VDCTLKSWDLKTGKNVNTFIGHTDWVWCMHVVDNSLYSGSRDTTVREWTISDGSTRRIYSGHESSVYRLRRQDNILYTCSWDGKLILWDVESGKVLRTFEHGEQIKCFVMHEDIVYTGDVKGIIRAWSKSKKVALYENHGHSDALTQLLIKDDYLYSSSLDGKIKKWDLLTIESLGSKKSHWSQVKIYVQNIGGTRINVNEPKSVTEVTLRPRTKSTSTKSRDNDDKKRSNSVH